MLAIVVGAISVPLQAQASSKEATSVEAPDWQVAAGEKLAFEVASVKPSAPDSQPRVNFTLGPGDVYASTGGRFLASSINLLDYIRFAYKLTDGQAEILRANAPDWITTERFDIQAMSKTPNPTKDQMRLMMQALLAERFKLGIHAEVRELPVLALVLIKPGKPGPQLRPHPTSDSTCSDVMAPMSEDSDSRHALESPTVCGGLVSTGVPGAPSHVRLTGRKVSLTLLAAHLGEMGHYDRPIVDQTGLTGTFDLVLEWGADPPGSTDSPHRDDNQSLLQEALKTELGLKLERTRAPSTAFFIDHLDRQPTQN
ncbi:TIGR03435 family protein [Terriglobus albidus]|uniref:TIGR03435 family protein n=1 Tax=Terriglobus albidus TaxID=1592106 RepID=UPI00164DC878|nr:TIGR03435 family protein [Terriglobus albidus]